jgi:uncharacterized protein
VADPEGAGWLHPALEVRGSSIAGRGLFTRQDLAANTVVLRLPRDGDVRLDLLGPGFPNHCCDPTVGWLEQSTLATMTDLPAETELLTDYAMAVHDPAWLLRCHCPSYRCRQMVEGSDWRIPALQARYAGWWRPSVQGLIEDAATS